MNFCILANIFKVKQYPKNPAQKHEVYVNPLIPNHKP